MDFVCRRGFIADVKHKLLGKLSKGYPQRVGLAQAILHNPDLLVLDEPTAGLDRRQINATSCLLINWAQQLWMSLSPPAQSSRRFRGRSRASSGKRILSNPRQALFASRVPKRLAHRLIEERARSPAMIRS